ncbi:MAG: HAMP domain-containing protein, partial [Spirochaetaceae bacterium]|nr:HAMP domain-containing protein [Spirochaetaceae bacterium]
SELTEAGTGEPELWTSLSQDETYLDVAGHLHTIRDAYGFYDSIQIADAETGIVFVSTDNSTLGTDLSNDPSFVGALLTRTVHIDDATARSRDHQPALYFSHLISDGQGGAVGVLTMVVEAGVIMKSVLQADPFLGESGEVLLVNQNAEVLTALEYPLADGSVAKPLQYKMETLPAQLASRGEEGIIETYDYREREVLAAYRHISLNLHQGWGLVVKRDYAELNAPIRREINNVVIIGVVGIAVFMVLTILIARSVTNPIRSLRAAAERIAGGDLDARAEITTSHEIGMLGRTFNQMAESLAKTKAGLVEKVRELEIEVAEHRRTEKELERYREHLEVRVRERTEELRKTVNLLAGRENRMAELKEVVRRLRAQLEEAGMTPAADDPLLGGDDEAST